MHLSLSCKRLLASALVTVALASPAAIAGPLDAQLDQYLELFDSKPVEANALLASLEPQLQQLIQPEDQSRLLVYLMMAAGTRQDVQAQKHYVELAEKFLQEHPNIDFQAEQDSQKYYFYKSQNLLNEANAVFNNVLRLAPNVESPRIRYVVFSFLGSEWQNRNNFPEALKAYITAYKTLENYHHPRTPARKLVLANSMIQLNISMENFNEAKSLLKSSIELGLRSDNLRSQVPDLYRLQAHIESEENNHGAAEQTLRRALQLSAQYPGLDTFLLENNLGDALLKQKKLKEASAAFERAYQIAQKQNFRDGIATAQFNRGYAMLLDGQVKDGIALMAEMVSMAEQDQVPEFEMISYYEELADGYKLAGMHAEEAETVRKQLNSSQRLFQSERDKQMSALQEAFSAEQKAREIETLKQQNALKTAEIETKQLQQRVVILFGLVLVLGSSLLYLLYRKVRSANSMLQQANDQLAYTSTHDPLTGLLNRRSLQDYMASRTAKDERRKTQTDHEAFILLDVDFFKHINDHFGHQAGDVVLVELGRRLKKLTRTDDMVLRWGGEEFLILLRRIEQDALEQLVQRVLNAIGNTPVVSGDHHIHVTVSAGFITMPFDGLSDEQLGWEKALQLADMALYLGKVHGRNRAYGFKRLLKPFNEIQPQLEQDLSQAIEQQQVEMTLVLGPNAIV